MANLKVVRNRIQSVKSTQQITKAMKMVAASKLRKAQDAILQMRPYIRQLNGLLDKIYTEAGENLESEYAVERPVEKVLIMVITSDRGLCGAFNSNVIKAAIALINEKYPDQFRKNQVWIMPFGKKAYDFFSKRDFQLVDNYYKIFTELSFEKAREAASFVLDGFTGKRFDRVEIVYNEFKNVATQVLKSEQYLPILPKEPKKDDHEIPFYIYEPSAEEIIRELIPHGLKVQLYKSILESNASEHGARMTAMDQATENAGELLSALKLVYNRTRQAAITTEILEIVGGAEALANG
ncbi:MAG: ATP synthase F1 subunit gamma [Cyclobacteriaceae bacterium]|nr:ATP synthase F1 subunit gamma [Cyclobacteriaceae bacterium]